MNQSFPEEIRKIVGDRPFEANNVGLSRSDVLMFDQFVLKIQRQSAETDNECAAARFLAGKLPVPEVLSYVVEEGTAYTLMSRVEGDMLCNAQYMRRPKKLVRLAAEALHLLWQVDLAGCPDGVSPLDKRLESARRSVELGLVNMEEAEAGTYGPGGFADPAALLSYLERNRPEEDRVLTHGDFCLPNLFAKGDSFAGFIDLGKCGPADRWQDLALCLRSMRYNFEGRFGGPAYPGCDADLLLDELGVPMDREKLRYYLLLDELF